MVISPDAYRCEAITKSGKRCKANTYGDGSLIRCVTRDPSNGNGAFRDVRLCTQHRPDDQFRIKLSDGHEAKRPMRV